jgi:hypothetical protein
MPTISQFVIILAAVFDRPESEIQKIASQLTSVGKLKTGGRGLNAPHQGPAEISYLIIGILSQILFPTSRILQGIEAIDKLKVQKIFLSTYLLEDMVKEYGNSAKEVFEKPIISGNLHDSLTNIIGLGMRYPRFRQTLIDLIKEIVLVCRGDKFNAWIILDHRYIENVDILEPDPFWSYLYIIANKDHIDFKNISNVDGLTYYSRANFMAKNIMIPDDYPSIHYRVPFKILFNQIMELVGE